MDPDVAAAEHQLRCVEQCYGPGAAVPAAKALPQVPPPARVTLGHIADTQRRQQMYDANAADAMRLLQAEFENLLRPRFEALRLSAEQQRQNRQRALREVEAELNRIGPDYYKSTGTKQVLDILERALGTAELQIEGDGRDMAATTKKLAELRDRHLQVMRRHPNERLVSEDIDGALAYLRSTGDTNDLRIADTMDKPHNRALLTKQIWAESTFNPNQISPTGPKGYMQLTKANWERYSPKGTQVFDRVPNVVAGLRYIFNDGRYDLRAKDAGVYRDEYDKMARTRGLVSGRYLGY